MALEFILLFSLTLAVSGTDLSGFVYAAETSEGLMDFRSIGLQQPNQVIDHISVLRQYCCKGHNPAGSYRDHGPLVSVTVALLRNADFSYNNITMLDEGSFENWKLMRKLRLDFNGMVHISKDAFSEQSLTHLSLKGNKLVFADFKMLADVVSVIDISHNYLQGIRRESWHKITKLELSDNLFSSSDQINFFAQDLHLENNKISTFPVSVSTINKLKSNLFLDRNLIEVLGGSVSNLHLAKLSVSRNRIYTIKEEFFVDAITLVFVDLSYNYLTEIAERTFSNLHSLATIDLSANRLRQVDVYSFYRMLGLQKFFITGNAISQIPDEFLKLSRELQTLEISGKTRLPEYFENFAQLDKLKWFDADVTSLENLSSSVPRLSHLELHSMTVFNIAALMNAYNVSKLHALVVSDSKLGEVPAKMMNTAKSLQFLSFACNNLLIVNLALFPSTLVEANLSNNFIKEVLSPRINHLRSLKILDLQYNQLCTIPSYVYQLGTVLLFTNVKNNMILNLNEQLQSRQLRSQFLCFHDKCVNMRAMLQQYSEFDTITTNLLACRCHTSIRKLEGFYTRNVFVQRENFTSHLFRNYIMGCIKHASIYNGSDLSSLYIFASLASELSSLYLQGWNVATVDNFHLGCAPQLRQLAIVRSSLIYIHESAFSSIPHLRKLDLSRNKLSKFEFGSLQYIPKLRDLNLSRNLLTQIQIPQNIPFINIVQLKILDLSHNLLSTLDFEQLYILTELEELYLFQNQITNPDLFCDQLNNRKACHNISLKILSLANNKIPEWTLSKSWTLRRLRNLDLSANEICRYEGEEFNWICYLNLNDNCMTNFEQSGCLQGGFILHISNNHVNDISNVKLKYSPKILNASRNIIREIKRGDMTDKLTLIELYLAHNLIKHLGGGCFNKMIQLKILDLSDNQLRTFYAKSIFGYRNNAYNWNQHILEELILSDNPELTSLVVAVNNSAVLKTKLSVSKLCTIITNNCPISGDDIMGESVLADIKFTELVCDINGSPQLKLVCVN